MRYDWNTELPILAFRSLGGKLLTLEGGSKGQPKSPDYAGAAVASGQASKEVTRDQTWANRPDMNTPWGKQSWDSAAAIDPATGQPVTQWTSNINLNPAEQASLEGQQRIGAAKTGTAESLLGQVAGATKDPFNWDAMPDTPGSVGDAQSSAYQKLAGNLQPGRGQQQEALHARLLSSGLPEGSEAWKRAEQGLQDQWTSQDKSMQGQAMSEGRADVSTQSQIRQQAISEEAQRRGMSLNELNALLTGSQVSMPQGFAGAPNTTAGVAKGTDYLGAANSQGSFNTANKNPGTDWGSAIGGVASAAAMFSDRRLKKNVKALGGGWYEFEYIWGGGKQTGVMAQELLLTRPELVHIHPSGYLMVDYGGL